MTTTTTRWGTPEARQVLPVTAPEELWLEARTHGIGGSEIPTITRAHSYQTPYELWLEKTATKTPEPTTNNLFWFGHKVEPILAERFTSETGIQTRNTGMWRNKNHPWMLANPDRYTSDCGVLEIKTTTRYTDNGKTYLAGQVPEAHRQQLTWYMMVTGRHTGHIIALVDREPVILDVAYDHDYAEQLVQAGQKFWEHVEARIPPPLDPDTITGTEALQRWPEADAGSHVEAADSFETEMILTWLAEAKQEKATAESAIREYESKLKAQIGDHEYLTVNGDPVARWQSVKPRASFDKDRALSDLAEYAGVDSTDDEYQDLVDRYTKTGKPSRRFTIIQTN
ncbi:YqaJ viral recombinase family protein [Auritidibacter sp. NML100628]|uniref:YqaJ viral recombinase family nuclease n=1 Tax=Auritidibacter sp. NML100628 TaxID=2170742 RepID=UPI000D72A143|nr:YqaJ viral recombinase family protein [Auritidibacter sp. NML100628]PXA77904.1 hypothetical protein DCC24_03150 [Auritidibacter sp. NML100628]